MVPRPRLVLAGSVEQGGDRARATVRPPWRTAKVWPAASAAGLPSVTVACTVSPGMTAPALPAPLAPPATGFLWRLEPRSSLDAAGNGWLLEHA